MKSLNEVIDGIERRIKRGIEKIVERKERVFISSAAAGIVANSFSEYYNIPMDLDLRIGGVFEAEISGASSVLYIPAYTVLAHHTASYARKEEYGKALGMAALTAGYIAASLISPGGTAAFTGGLIASGLFKQTRGNY